MRDPFEEPLTPHAETHQEPQTLCPPRFWWLRRLTVAGLTLALSMVAVRLAWGREADRRLRRLLDDLAARGEPVRLTDLNSTPVSVERNAAAYLRRAAEAVQPGADSPSSSALTYNRYPPYPPQWHALSDNSVKANGAAYALARRARAHQRFDWGTEWTTPAYAVTLPYLNQARHLANIVSDAGLRAHLQGDDVTALETTRDVLHAARSVSSQPAIICYLVGVGVDSIAIDKLQVIATGLRIAPGDGPPPEPPGDAAPPAALLPATQPSKVEQRVTRRHVKAVIAELLDERPWRDALPYVLAGEQAVHIDTGLWLARRTWLVRPSLTLDTVRLAETNRPHIDAAREQSWPESEKVLARGNRLAPPPPKHFLFSVGPAGAPGAPVRPPPVDYTRLLSDGDLSVNGWRVIMQDMRWRQQRRMTAVSLAAQLYLADHGDWPPHLQSLVPQYLPDIPTDPFAPNGAPLRYLLARGALPGGGDRPVVYSVNENGVDDTPDAPALPAEPQFGWRRARDSHLDLARWAPPTTMPATAPADGP